MNGGAVKKVLVVGIFFIAYVLWQAVGTLSEYYPIHNYPPAHKGPIVLFGDALTVASSTSFVGILEKRLGIEIEVESTATSTLQSAASVVPARILERRPGAVIFCFSDTNDRTQWNDTHYVEDLRGMIHAAQKEGAVTVLLGARREGAGSEHERIIKKLARETGSITVVNILSTIADDPRYWSNDLPNMEGNIRIADIVAPALEGLSFGITENITEKQQ